MKLRLSLNVCRPLNEDDVAGRPAKCLRPRRGVTGASSTVADPPPNKCLNNARRGDNDGEDGQAGDGVKSEGGGEQRAAAADPPPSNGAKIKTVNDQQTKQRGLLEVARPPWRAEWCGEGRKKEREGEAGGLRVNGRRAGTVTGVPGGCWSHLDDRRRLLL